MRITYIIYKEGCYLKIFRLRKFLLKKEGGLLFSTVGSKKKWTNLKMSYIFEKTTDFDNIFGENPDRLQLFFAHVFSSIGLVFKKLQAKTYFFTFSKTLKNTYMTSKIHPPKHRHYEFFSYFGFGLKQSIAIFSAIQNVIWSWFDDFRAFWKLLDFPFLTCFLSDFLPFFACKIWT